MRHGDEASASRGIAGPVGGGTMARSRVCATGPALGVLVGPEVPGGLCRAWPGHLVHLTDPCSGPVPPWPSGQLGSTLPDRCQGLLKPRVLLGQEEVLAKTPYLAPWSENGSLQATLNESGLASEKFRGGLQRTPTRTVFHA